MWGECQTPHLPPTPPCPLQPQDAALGAAGTGLAAFGVSWEMAQGAVDRAGGLWEGEHTLWDGPSHGAKPCKALRGI